MDSVAIQVNQDFQDIVVYQVLAVIQESLDSVAIQENQVIQDIVENQVFQVTQGYQDTQVQV